MPLSTPWSQKPLGDGDYITSSPICSNAWLSSCRGQLSHLSPVPVYALDSYPSSQFSSEKPGSILLIMAWQVSEATPKHRSSLLFHRLSKPRPGIRYINTWMMEYCNLLRDIMHIQSFTLNTFLINANSLVNLSPFENLWNFPLRGKFRHSETERKKCFS